VECPPPLPHRNRRAVKLLAQMSRRSLGGSVMWNQRTFHGGPIKFYFSIANNKNQGLFRRRDITF
jgi:hypothetical protein